MDILYLQKQSVNKYQYFGTALQIFVTKTQIKLSFALRYNI